MCSCFLNALAHKNQARTPIWIMRQAGRYMPAYQALKRRFPIETLFRKRELIVQVTELPIALLDVDAAILFSDILMVLDILGVSWEVMENIGPVIHEPLTISSHLTPIEGACQSTMEAISELKKRLQVPLIGFAGAPFTIASYLIEGKSPKGLKKTQKWITSHPDALHKLLKMITQATISYLQRQIHHGVDAIQLFESYGGALPRPLIEAWVLPSIQEILQKLPLHIPSIVFAKHSHAIALSLAKFQPTALSVDWTVELKSLRKIIDPKIALQGNLDPTILLGSKKALKQKVISLLNSMKNDPGYIFNLGHGILPQTPWENAQTLVELVKCHP